MRFPRVIALVVLAAVFLLSIEYGRRQDLYWYDAGQDYRFEFSSERVAVTPVQVSDSGFVVPSNIGKRDTVLLRMRISSTSSGYWFEPFVSIDANGSSAQQFLERGARGVRYLSLSGLQLDDGEKISLKGHHLKWKPQVAELLRIRNQDLEEQKLLVLAPHPDDAEIAAFGLYSQHHSFIATITAGSYVDGLYAHIYEDTTKQDELRAEMRTWDSLTVPLLGGVDQQRIVNLGYRNGSLQMLYAARNADPAAGDSQKVEIVSQYRRGAVTELLGNRRASHDWASLVADLSALLESVEPDVIVAPHPGLDLASDHQLTTRALIEALDRAADTRSVLFLYTNHHVLSEYYPFGPSGSLVGLPPWFESDALFAAIYSHSLEPHEQVRKLFALEAMHDLRPAPERFYGGPARRFIGRLYWAAKGVVADPLGTYSYFRRAVRPNEIFFVYEPDERHLLDTFEDRD